MLNEMDGFNATGIIVLAATNRSDVLDPALTRPGRLDRTIHVPLPDRRGRQSILEVHSKGRPMSSDVDFTGLARRTPGFSGAELAQLVNEACMEAGRRGDERVNHDCFASALATVALGKARTSALVTENDRLITAWHEAGHTLTALLIPDADDPVQVSITPRGPAGGVTWMSGSDDLFLTRSGAYAKLTVAMAGRAAEQHLLHGEYTSGAHGDIQSATNLAMAMATQYGMTDLGLAWRPEQMLAAGGGLLDKADEVVNKMLEDSRASAYDILKDNFESLKAIAEGLLDQETLTLAEVRRIHLDVSQKLGKDAELPVKARHGDFEDEEAVPTATTDEGNPEQSLDYTNPAKTV
jgi:cell division protease FtsH